MKRNFIVHWQRRLAVSRSAFSVFSVFRLHFGLGLACLLGGAAAPAAEVTVNEILANNQSIAPLADFPDYFPDYVELYNTTPNPIDLAAGGWSLTTKKTPNFLDFGDHYDFPSGTVLPAESYLLVFFDNKTNFPGLHTAWTTGGTNKNFSLKRAGDQLQIFKSGGTILVESNGFGMQIADRSIGRFPDFTGDFTLTIPTPCGGTIPCVTNTPAPFLPAPASTNQFTLRINEWLATNSSSGNKDWFEVYNPDTNVVALSGVVFVDKLTSLSVPKDSRPVPALSYIAPLGFAQFFAVNNSSADAPANEVSFSISSSSANGDEIFMVANDKVTVLDHVHSSLVKQADISEGRVPDGGDTIITLPKLSPEASNFGQITNVVINEILSHTDLPLEDAIEFYNPTAASVDISYYWLSNRRDTPKKFHLPAGSVIPAHGFRVFYEYQFNPDFTGNDPSFTFNSANGDEAWLFSANAAGKLTGFRLGITFPAAQNGVSFGRYVTSDGRADFVPTSALSFGTSVTAQDPPSYRGIFRTGTGASNPAPRIGPLVINEIHFHPLPIVSGIDLLDNTLDEFVELFNSSGQPLELFDPLVYRADRTYTPQETADGTLVTAGEIYADGRTNVWRMRGDVDLDFPLNTTVPAGGFILLVNFNPTNTSVLDTFKSKFQVPNGVLIFGPYSSKLGNGSSTLELQRPDPPQGPQHPDFRLVPRTLIERVKYFDRDPWPTQVEGDNIHYTDGGGASLQRISDYEFGDDPANWRAALPTAGRFNTASGVEAPTIATQPHSQSVSAGTTVNLTVVARGGQLAYQWLSNGVALADRTNTLLRFVNASTNLSANYQVAVTNLGGAITSSVATLVVNASKPDASKPTVSIVGPPAALQTNEAILVNGKAGDNIGVNAVLYSVNGGSSIAATGSVTWSVWGTPVPVLLSPGTNVVVAVAIDQAGNSNVTQRSFFYSIRTPLSLAKTGVGTVAGATNGQRLEVGRNFTLTATPGLGYLFSNWVLTTNLVLAEMVSSPSLIRPMVSNLAVTANFIPNPFTASAGSFNGLFYDTNDVEHGSSGFFNFTMTALGAYTAKIQHDGRKLTAAGKLDLIGLATNVVKRTGTNDITVVWSVDLGNTRAIRGTVTDGHWAADVLGDRLVFKLPGTLCTNAGKYTFAIQGFAGSTTSPAGHSYGTVVIGSNGVAKLTAVLADKTKGTVAVPLSLEGAMPLYLPQVKGSLISWVVFTNRPTDDFSGLLEWHKLTNPAAPLYKSGFGGATAVLGSRYTPPVGTTGRVLALSSGEALFSDGNLAESLTNLFTIGAGNKVTNGGPAALTLTFTPATGLFAGTVKPTNSAKALAFTGAVLQKGTNGFGFLLGTNQSSSVLLR